MRFKIAGQVRLTGVSEAGKTAYVIRAYEKLLSGVYFDGIKLSVNSNQLLDEMSALYSSPEQFISRTRETKPYKFEFLIDDEYCFTVIFVDIRGGDVSQKFMEVVEDGMEDIIFTVFNCEQLCTATDDKFNAQLFPVIRLLEQMGTDEHGHCRNRANIFTKSDKLFDMDHPEVDNRSKIIKLYKRYIETNPNLASVMDTVNVFNSSHPSYDKSFRLEPILIVVHDLLEKERKGFTALGLKKRKLQKSLDKAVSIKGGLLISGGLK